MGSGRAMVLRAANLALELQDRPAPQARRGEAVVRLRASSVNYHDVLGLQGKIRGALYPRVPFSDGCGEVVAVGDDVTRVKPGDRVMPNFFAHWIAGPPTPEALTIVHGDQIDGCLQTHATFKDTALVAAPDHLSDVEAATLGCAGLTAWRSLVVDARVKPGDIVVAQGTGGVSLFALGFAKMLGATVILTSSSDEKLERGRELGADHTINYRSQDWARRVLEITDGRGADHLLDVGGPETLPAAIKAAKLGGFISVIGVLTGEEQPVFPLRAVMSKNLTVKGLTVGSRSDFDEMSKAVSAARYHPVVEQVFDLENAGEAISAMQARGHMGKLAIRIS